MSLQIKPIFPDAEWYFCSNSEEKRFYDIFFSLCRKYNIRWSRANEKEKEFIETLTREAYNRDREKRLEREDSEEIQDQVNTL